MTALVWNIIRDLRENKIRLQIKASAGGFVAKSEMSLLFQENIGKSELKDGQTPKILFTIINTGGKPVAIKSIAGTYKSGEKLFVVSDGLPKMLQPYEIHSQPTNDGTLISHINQDRILDIYVDDTAGHKWKLGRKQMKYLKSTCSKFL